MGRRRRPESSAAPESCVKWCSEAECWWLVLLCGVKINFTLLYFRTAAGVAGRAKLGRRPPLCLPHRSSSFSKAPESRTSTPPSSSDAEQLSAPLATHLFFLGAAKVPWSHSSPLDSTVPVSTFAALLAFLAP